MGGEKRQLSGKVDHVKQCVQSVQISTELQQYTHKQPLTPQHTGCTLCIKVIEHLTKASNSLHLTIAQAAHFLNGLDWVWGGGGQALGTGLLGVNRHQ